MDIVSFLKAKEVEAKLGAQLADLANDYGQHTHDAANLTYDGTVQGSTVKEALDSLGGIAPITDHTNAPGNKSLIAGDVSAGFYGFVLPENMGLLVDNPADKQAFNGSNLALAVGLSAGTAFNINVPLMKFSYKSKILFIPLTGYRYSVPWDSIYNAGLVYGTSDEGFLPPMGRCGTQLGIDGSDNSINSSRGDFLGDKTEASDYADTVASVGDRLVLKGWATADNNKTVTVQSITASKIIVEESLTTETGGKKSRFYKESARATQNKTVNIGGIQCAVRLMRGAGSDPLDSYADADRGTIGPGNEWNDLILPLHEHAKLGNWNYTAYAKNDTGGPIADWKIGLTDEMLRTHYNYGSGSYTWCQEASDTTTYSRVIRGYGASYSNAIISWGTNSHYCWRPVLVVL